MTIFDSCSGASPMVRGQELRMPPVTGAAA
jgi:hypothetical protein